MYCTISGAPVSTGGLTHETAAAYYEFRSRARTLGAISSSFQTLTSDMTVAYYEALTRTDNESWSAVLARTAVLMQRAEALSGIPVFDAKDREALDFFESILRENADLITVPAVFAARAAA